MTRLKEIIDIPIDAFGIDPKYLSDASLISNELDNVFSQEFAVVAGLSAQGQYYKDWALKIRTLQSGQSRYLSYKLPTRKQVTNLHRQISRLVIALSSIIDLTLITNVQYSVNSLPNQSPIQFTEHAKRWLAVTKPQEYYPIYDFSDPENLPKIGAAVPGNMLSYLKENIPEPTYLDIYLAILTGVNTELNSNKPDPNLLSKFISRSDPQLERLRQILTAFLNSLTLVNLPLSSVFSLGFDTSPFLPVITRLINLTSTVISDLNKAEILSRLASLIFTGNYASSDIELLRKLLNTDPTLFSTDLIIPDSTQLLPQLIKSFNNTLLPNETVNSILDAYIDKSSKLDGALGISGNYVAAGLVHFLKAVFILNDLTQGIVDPAAFRVSINLLIQGLIFLNDSGLSQFELIISQVSGLVDSMKLVNIDALALESNSRFTKLRDTLLKI